MLPLSRTRIRSYERIVRRRSVHQKVRALSIRCMHKQLTGDANQSPVFELGLNSLLNLFICFQIDRRTAKCNVSTMHSFDVCHTYVASSRMTTLVSRTSARARLRRDLSPTLRLDPSVSITVSRVILPEGDSTLESSSDSIKYDRRNASHRRASS